MLTFSAFAVTACSNSSGSEKSDTKTSKSIETPLNATSKSESTGQTIKLTKQGFIDKIMDYEKNPEEWKYIGDKPAIIDFYADWCGPCKIAAPVLEDLAAKYKDEIYIYKVDTEVERELASVFGIRSIPAFLFIPEEGQPTMSNGIARTPEETKEMFIKMIDEILLGKGTQETL